MKKRTQRKLSSRKRAKPHWEMNSTELAAATHEFDREFIADTFGSPPASARAQLRRAQRRGRPRVGEGAQRVLVTVERELLAAADAYAKQHRLNRSQLIAQGLRKMIGPKAA